MATSGRQPGLAQGGRTGAADWIGAVWGSRPAQGSHGRTGMWKRDCRNSGAGSVPGQLGRVEMPPRREVWATTTGIGAALAGDWFDDPAVGARPRTRRAMERLLAGALVLFFGTFLGLLGIRTARLTGLLAILDGWLALASFMLPYAGGAIWTHRLLGALPALSAIALTGDRDG